MLEPASSGVAPGRADGVARVVAALRIGWRLQELAFLDSTQSVAAGTLQWVGGGPLELDLGGSVALVGVLHTDIQPLCGHALVTDLERLRDAARRGVLASNALRSLDEQLRARMAASADAHVVLPAYELGKTLGDMLGHVSQKMQAYADGPSEARATEAHAAWLNSFAWRRVQGIHRQLAMLRQVLSAAAVNATLEVVDHWYLGLRDPSDSHWLGPMGSRRKVLRWARGSPAGEFTPEKATRLAVTLSHELSDCFMLLTGGGAGPAEAPPGPASAPPPPRAAHPSDLLEFTPQAIEHLSVLQEGVRHMQGGLLAMAAVAPVFAAMISVALYADPGYPFRAPLALAALVNLVLSWVVLAVLVPLLGFTGPDRASMGTYGEVLSQIPELDEWSWAVRRMPPGDVARQQAARELQRQLQEIKREQHRPGPRWVLGTGYITLWQRIHRAQEAVIEVAPPSAVIHQAEYDILRIQSSNIDNNDTYVRLLSECVELLGRATTTKVEEVADQLHATLDALRAVRVAETGNNRDALRAAVQTTRDGLKALPERLDTLRVTRKLDQALGRLGETRGPAQRRQWLPLHLHANGHVDQKGWDELTRVLTQMLGELDHFTDIGAPAGRAPAESGLRPGSLRSPRSVPEAVATVRTLRRLIGEFRDDRRAGLVRARNQLVVTVGATSITAYTLVWLALAALPSNLQPADSSLAAAHVAAIEAGLAYYLFGATVGLFVRLYTERNAETGVDDFGLSFARLLAAPLLSGVAGVVGVVVVATAAAVQLQANGTASGAATDVLANAFSIPHSPANLVTAGVFGLAPGLLIDRLTQNGESYKKDLKSSEAPGPNTKTR